jgi:hypothetical protein
VYPVAPPAAQPAYVPVPVQPVYVGPPPAYVAVPPPPPPAWEKRAAAPPARNERASRDDSSTLFNRPSIGGYGGVSVAYTHMLNRGGALFGLEGALLIGHRLTLGLAGYGFSRSPEGPADADGTPRQYGAGYGGFVGRYALFNNGPLYLSVGVLLGGGAVLLHRDWDQDGSVDDSEPDDVDQADGFFVAQPELALHVHLTRWMRVGLNCGYRFTNGIQRWGLTDSDVNGLVAGGSLQFGWL